MLEINQLLNKQKKQREGNGKSKSKIYEIEKAETLKTKTKRWHLDEIPQNAKYLTRSTKTKNPITRKVFWDKQIYKTMANPKKTTLGKHRINGLGLEE